MFLSPYLVHWSCDRPPTNAKQAQTQNTSAYYRLHNQPIEYYMNSFRTPLWKYRDHMYSSGPLVRNSNWA